MTKTTRIFTMNDLKVPSVVDAVKTRMHVEDNELISSSLAYSTNVQAFVKEAPDFWPTYLKGRDIGLIPSHWTDDDAYDQFMIDTVKSLNKLPFRIQLTALTCLERNLPMTQVTVVDVKAGIASYDRSVLTITTGLDISLFAYVFHHVVTLLDDDCRRSSTLKPDGSFVFEINIITNGRKDHAKSCYINLTGLEAERLTIHSCESVLLPESVGFKLSDDTKFLITTLEQDVYTKVRECLERDYGLRISFVGAVNSVQKHTDQQNYVKAIDCILVNRNQFPVRKEHLNELVTSVISIKKLAKAVSNISVFPPAPIMENIMDEPKPPAPENTGEPVYTFMQPEVSSFYNLPNQTVHDHMVKTGSVPDPGSLMNPHYGWEHIDPETGASSFRDHPQSLSMSETQPEEIKDTIVPEPKITNGELTKLHDRLSALECWVGVRIAEQKELIKTYAERAVFHGNGMFSIVKVAKLPNGRIPNAMYLVGEPNSDKFDLYVTGMNGELRALNTGKDEKEITRAICKTLEISDPNAVKAWIKQTQAVAANIETYYKHRESDSEMETSVVTEKTSIQGMLEDTKSALKQIAADQDRIARNSISGAMVGNVTNTKTKSKEPDTGMELTGWRELSALAKHLNIDLSDIYVFLTSDGKVEIREHVMFPSKEYLDQIGKTPVPSTNSPSNTHMSNSALIHNVETLYMSLYGHREIIDASVIARCSSSISDMFFAVERELGMRTDESVRMLAHAGYKVNVSYIPIPDAAPLCTRMFQIGKDGNNLSFAFYDSIPVRA